MEPQSPDAAQQINRFLPYWAVFMADLKQGLRSWIYRVWVILTFAAGAGYLIYRFGAKQVGGFVQPASAMMSDLLQWITLGGLTLVIVLTSGTICSERGMVADSVLSRGISRVQYFLGKWHARLVLVLGTFFAMAVLALAGSTLLLHSETLSLLGALVAVVVVASLLVVVITCGVTISAMSTNTVVSIALAWVFLSGFGYLLSMLPARYPSPDRVLQNLPNMLQGRYDLHDLSRLISGSLSASLLLALGGIFYFSRRDV